MAMRLGHPGNKPDASRAWTTPVELAEFDVLRESGQITFFREAACKGEFLGKKCGRAIPKGKDFCSKKCAGVDDAAAPGDDVEDFDEE